MKQFNGFPARMEFAAIPRLFFSALLPEINDMAELKTSLHVMAALYRKRGYPRVVTLGELLDNASLMNSLKSFAKPPDEVLRGALKLATERGTFLHIAMERDAAGEDVYLLNDESGRQVAARIQSGEVKIPGFKPVAPRYVEAGEPPNIFTLYEQNIGLLTPIIADELREAEKLYPENWIVDAIKEATLLNKRNIRYIMKILQRWSSEGKSDGAYQRDSKKGTDKYFKQKYGHMVQR